MRAGGGRAFHARYNHWIYLRLQHVGSGSQMGILEHCSFIGLPDGTDVNEEIITM